MFCVFVNDDGQSKDNHRNHLVVICIMKVLEHVKSAEIILTFCQFKDPFTPGRPVFNDRHNLPLR